MMRKGEVLKTVVIVQAVCMIVLTGLVVVKMWPLLAAGSGGAGSIVPGGGASGDGTPGGGGAGDGGEPGGGIDPGVTGPGGGSGEAVASIGGITITGDELTAELYAMYGDAVLRSILVHRAVELESAAAGLAVSPLEFDRELALAAEAYGGEEPYYEAMRRQLGLSKAQVRAELRHRLLLEEIAMQGVPPVSNAEVNAYIAEHADLYAPQVQLHLQWILTATRGQAEDVLRRLEEGATFAALANAYSMDEYTADSGGDLGFIPVDDPYYDPVLLAEAESLAVGDIAGPLALEQGYAVVRLSGRKSNGGLAHSELVKRVRKELLLNRAKPLAEVEEMLLKRYDAAVVK